MFLPTIMVGCGIAGGLTSVLPVAWQTVWQDLEVENEMSRGLLPGLVVLSGKLAPTLRATTQRTLHSVAQVLSDSTTPNRSAGWRVDCRSVTCGQLAGRIMTGHHRDYMLFVALVKRCHTLAAVCCGGPTPHTGHHRLSTQPNATGPAVISIVYRTW